MPDRLLWQFVASDSMGSKAIRWFGGGPGYSHVDAILPDGSLLGARDDHVGGKPPGVQIRPPGYERWSRRKILALPCTADQHALWVRFLIAKLGDKYDEDAILGFIFGQHWHTKGAYICSALQTAALRAAGYIEHLCVEPQQVSPNGLALVVSALGAVPVRSAASPPAA